MSSHCPACGAADVQTFLTNDEVPTNSCVLLDSAREAREYPTGDLKLALCPSCGFISNTTFDPAMTTYSTSYEETQGFSPRFRQYARQLATQWIERHDLADRHVLEIGCGKGEFLVLLSEIAGTRGTGMDPAFVPERSQHDPQLLTFVQDLFDERWLHLEPDAVVCRHTLEHLDDVRGFLRTLRTMIGDREDVPVLFELPDSTRILRDVAFWDVYYEHCSYFTPGSLARLFRQEGFVMTDLSLCFDEQYIVVEALPAERGVVQAPFPIEEPPAETEKLVSAFTRSYESDLAARRARLRSWVSANERVVIWGAGSKGVAWLTSLGITDEIRYAVDINPHKHDRYMAGTGQQIVAPEYLTNYQPDRVVVMNAIYRDEIRAVLDRLGVETSLVDA